MKKVLSLCFVCLCMLNINAQTDLTSYIKNPSFEQDVEGWTHKGMSAQGNNAFSLKSGNTYMEKWTGIGGAVGDGYLIQEISNLPPGNYELTAVAQNIQEDKPTNAQSGTSIFAGDNRTTVTIRDRYTVAFNYVSGSISIGFEAKSATGNWIAVDDFRLTLVGDDLSDELAASIAEATSKYGNATGSEVQQLKDAIASAQAVAERPNATGEEQASAIIAIEEAVEKYLCSNASEENPLDMTERILNPSFETGDFTGWTAVGMSMQSNNVFNVKKVTWYVERWTWKGNSVGDARLSQSLNKMPAGRYRLTATAQNIQEDTPQAKQSGAWIFAGVHTEGVNVRGTYTLVFEQVSDVMELGFEAKGATGNWLAIDNFRLEYIGNSFEDIKAGLTDLLAKAEAMVTQRMDSKALEALQTAISTVKPLLSQSNTDGWSEAARNLESAYSEAVSSHESFASLAAAIAAAKDELTSSQATQKDEYQSAIAAAQAVYDNASTTDAEAEAAIAPLTAAAFAFKVLNGSGTPPTVETDPRFIRGCTWAFGRSSVSGSDIIEEGFCWAENPDPRVTDNRTTEYMNQAGKIYWIRNLKPATIYYMRAYAVSKNYAVGYGDVIKVVTVPKGSVGHWYNNGGDEETNDRINYAINTSMDYYWNNLTSIHGFGISVTYSPGTPTADCNYGGGMRVGASSSYQQPGTIMHEALHGIGVGTHGMWWSADMRSDGSRGDWLGDRVTEAVRFWDNSPTAVITGDDMHLWPYGCNGAHEDNHSDNLYCMMGILAQALNEDGLPGSSEIGYALPYYSFTHEDGKKYYIKNEDEKRGLRSSYLVETASHTLEWKAMDADEAFANDAAAWYLSFTPDNQYYQLRNAGSGYYMTYSSGFKTAKHATATSADNLHLMRGRVDVEGHRGYYIIHPESSANPPALVGNASGKTGSSAWNISKSATSQRWLILSSEEAEHFDNGDLSLSLKELEKVVAQIRQLSETPHTEDAEGADERLALKLSSIEEQAKSCTKGKEVAALTKEARDAGRVFLESVSASDVNNPFDLTFMLENPDFDNDATSGWTSTNGAPGYEAGCAEFYERTFDYYQTLSEMPKGVYQLRANAFQRCGETHAAFSQYSSGKESISSFIYINSTSKPVKSIYDERHSKLLYNDGNVSDIQLSDNTYVPCVMKAASTYFSKGFYESIVSAELASSGATLKVGIKCTKAPTWYWTIFDHFRLLFYGQNHSPVGVGALRADEGDFNAKDDKIEVYDINGRRMSWPIQQRGIYIVRSSDGKSRRILIR